MLQEMRKYTKGVIATIFMAVLALSFVVWGIADIFRGNSDTSVATVGGEKIPSELLQRDYRNLSRQASQRGPLNPAESKVLTQQALDTLIDQMAVDTYLKRYGLTINDEVVGARIRSIPQFAGPLGTFDHERFLRVIQQVGFDNEQSFIDLMRGDMNRNQYLTATAAGLQLPSGYARALFNYLNEARAAEYIILPANTAGTLPQPTDAQLTAYVAVHGERFSTPEYREVSFAWLTPADVAGQIKVSDDQLKQQYELQKAQYVVPEKRDVEQLVYPTEAAAKAARARIDTGTSFEDLMKQQGKTEKDASLGIVVKEDLAERGAAVFALPKGGVTQPLKAPVGYSLLHVVDITPGSTKTFSDVKEDLRAQLATQLAGAKLADLGNQYIDESSRGESLAQAAKRIGMHVAHIAAVDANGNTPEGTKAPIPSDPELLQQMFKSEVGEEGDPFTAKSGATYVVKVEGVRPPKLKPLDAVRAEAIKGWQSKESSKLLEAKAKELAARATAAKSLGAIAGPLGLKVESSGMLRRPLANAPPSGTLPPYLVAKLFSVPGGQAVYGPAADGAYIVARVTGVQHPPSALLNDARLRPFAAQVGGQAGSDLAETVAAAARDKEGVTINQQNVDRISGEGG